MKKEKMSPIPSSKISDRESDNESTSKGNADPTVFKRHREQHIQGY